MWNQIKAARDNKSLELYVIWLDLKNAYGTHSSKKQWISFGFQKTLESLYQNTMNVYIWDILILNIPEIGRN